MKCPHCNQEHPDGFQFCPATGKKIEALKACTKNPKCPDHGKLIIPHDSKFCPTCGWSLEEKEKDKKLDLAVDLGLSVKWSKCNFGSEEHMSPEENRYRCSLFLNSGVSDDWGAHWRLPTKEEFEELISKCKVTSYTLNGVKGLKMIGPNGNSIFMPAAFYEDNEPEYQWLGAYFSCTKDENDIKNVYTFVFAPNTKEKSINPMIRDSVCLVRPVYDEKNEYMSDGIRFGDNVTFNIIYGPKNEEESDEEETDSNSDGPYLITNNCVACGICIDECPVGAISEGDIYVIDGDTCVGCGACASVCPNDAIEF